MTQMCQTSDRIRATVCDHHSVPSDGAQQCQGEVTV